jgi:pyruvate kinase
MRRTKSGVIPKAFRSAQHTDQVVEGMEDVLVSEGAVGPGDTLLFAAGAPLFVRGTTNLLHLRQVKARA